MLATQIFTEQIMILGHNHFKLMVIFHVYLKIKACLDVSTLPTLLRCSPCWQRHPAAQRSVLFHRDACEINKKKVN